MEIRDWHENDSDSEIVNRTDEDFQNYLDEHYAIRTEFIAKKRRYNEDNGHIEDSDSGNGGKEDSGSGDGGEED
jgi:hypothetical protein